jgi:hypothetical protein
MWNGFRHDLGYLEGGNIAFDYEYGDGVPERLAEAAAALVRRRYVRSCRRASSASKPVLRRIIGHARALATNACRSP